MSNKIKETIEFTYEWIKIYIKIDYINNKFYIVQPVWNWSTGKFYNKDFTFVGRWVEYMQGWIQICSAIQYAIAEAKKLYEAELARVSKFKVEDIVDLYNITKDIPCKNQI